MSKKNCHPLQYEKLCMFSVQNSQCYLNKMTFESIRDVLFVQEGIYMSYFIFWNQKRAVRKKV